MRNLDFTPLLRYSVGFDRMADMLNQVTADATPAYPPYNIEKISDNTYQISMAVAGFSEDDITLTAQENVLIIAGKIAGVDEDKRAFLHRGIAERSFERRFQLAQNIHVERAKLENGLLHVELIRELPEEAKPRSIPIATPQQNRVSAKSDVK
ncbi:MAG: Hsp20 family protein [Pseudomonadota bacterium]